MQQNPPGDAHYALRKYGRESGPASARESGEPDSLFYAGRALFMKCLAFSYRLLLYIIRRIHMNHDVFHVRELTFYIGMHLFSDFMSFSQTFTPIHLNL